MKNKKNNWKKEFRTDFFHRRFVGENIEKQACDYFKKFISNLLKRQKEEIEEMLNEMSKTERGVISEKLFLQGFNRALEEAIKKIKEKNKGKHL